MKSSIGRKQMASTASHRRFLALTIALASLFGLGAWAFASPIGSSPDEDYHLVSIWCGQGERSELCESGSKENEVRAPIALIISANCFAFNPESSSNCDLPPHEDFGTTTRSNSSGAYPPVFYWVMSSMASPNIEFSVILMRILNAAIFVFLLSVTVLVSPLRVQKPIIGGIFASIVPLGMFLIPSVNPSSWAVISASITWASLVGFYYSQSVVKQNALLAISLIATVLGAGARTDAAVYVGIALVVASLLSWKQIRTKPYMLLQASSVLPIALFFYFTSGSSSIATPASIGQGFDHRLAISNLLELPSLWVGALGGWGLGWLDTRMPSLVFVASVFVFSGIVFYGLLIRKNLKYFALSLLLVAITLIPLYVLINENLTVGSNVQPRYLYPLLIIMAGVSLWGIRVGKKHLNQAQIFVVVMGLSVANSVALHSNIRRYVTGIDVGGYNLDRDVEWWWSAAPSPMAIWLTGSIAFLVAAIFLGYLARHKKPKETPINH
jgi:hypothetical protein